MEEKKNEYGANIKEIKSHLVSFCRHQQYVHIHKTSFLPLKRLAVFVFTTVCKIHQKYCWLLITNFGWHLYEHVNHFQIKAAEKNRTLVCVTRAAEWHLIAFKYFIRIDTFQWNGFAWICIVFLVENKLNRL